MDLLFIILFGYNARWRYSFISKIVHRVIPEILILITNNEKKTFHFNNERNKLIGSLVDFCFKKWEWDSAEEAIHK